MTNYSYLWNLFSLAMGLAAWVLPLAGLLARRRAALCRELSLLCCSAALLGVIVYAGVLVTKEDWSALLDTWDVMVWVSGVLLAVTAVLHLVSWLRETAASPQ